MVGLDAIEISPPDPLDPLIRKSEPLEHDDDCIGIETGLRTAVEGKLDVGEHMRGIALGDQERPALPRCFDGESVSVNDAHAALDRVDAETDPGEVEERKCREHLEFDPVIGEQQFDGVLGHQR